MESEYERQMAEMMEHVETLMRAMLFCQQRAARSEAEYQRFRVRADMLFARELDALRLRQQPPTESEFSEIDDLTRENHELQTAGNDLLDRSAPPALEDDESSADPSR